MHNEVYRGFSRYLLTLFIILTLTACINYQGDGKLIKHGSRFLLNLGEVETNTLFKRQYKLKGLPSKEFVLGFKITSTIPIETIKESNLLTGNIKILLKRKTGEIVISENGKLSSWVWSYCNECTEGLIYKRGVQGEKQLSSDTIQLYRINELTNGGWGSYFTPDSLETYILSVEIITNTTSPISIFLEAESHGWK